jgi:hypothetical protein
MAHLPKADSKKANSSIMLTLQSLRLERNACVFDNSQKAAGYIVNKITSEWALWLQCKRRDGRIGEIG